MHLRWLTYTWAARILGWRKRRSEGSTGGFSAEFYRIIREVVYPFPKIEREERPLTCTPNSSNSLLSPGTSLLLRAAARVNSLQGGHIAVHELQRLATEYGFIDAQCKVDHTKLYDPRIPTYVRSLLENIANFPNKAVNETIPPVTAAANSRPPRHLPSWMLQRHDSASRILSSSDDIHTGIPVQPSPSAGTSAVCTASTTPLHFNPARTEPVSALTNSIAITQLQSTSLTSI